MSGKVIEFKKQQKYRFDFGTDDKLYVIIFKGKIPQAELKGMVSSLQNCLFEKMPEVILLYLKQHHLEYSNYNSIEIPLEKDRILGWAGYLLHSGTYEKVDENLEDADVYYSVMDCQRNTSEGHCEGCYFAVSRLPWGHYGYQYNTIAQKFSSAKHGLKEQSYFAIRKSDGNGNLLDIAKEEGEPTLPTFGCVDIMALLADIETIKTKEDALKIAVK